MKIVENTPERLVLTHRPWLLAALLWGGGGALLAAAAVAPESIVGTERFGAAIGGLLILVLAYLFAAFLRVVFDRRAGTVTISAQRLLPVPPRVVDLGDALKAGARPQWGETSRMTRLVLHTRRGDVPLRANFSGADNRSLARAINAWLAAG